MKKKKRCRNYRDSIKEKNFKNGANINKRWNITKNKHCGWDKCPDGTYSTIEMVRSRNITCLKKPE